MHDERSIVRSMVCLSRSRNLRRSSRTRQARLSYLTRHLVKNLLKRKLRNVGIYPRLRLRRVPQRGIGVVDSGRPGEEPDDNEYAQAAAAAAAVWTVAAHTLRAWTRRGRARSVVGNSGVF